MKFLLFFRINKNLREMVSLAILNSNKYTLIFETNIKPYLIYLDLGKAVWLHPGGRKESFWGGEASTGPRIYKDDIPQKFYNSC